MININNIAIAMLGFAIVGCGTNETTGTTDTTMETEQSEWTNMIEGNSLEKWHNFNKPDSIGGGWQVDADGVLYLNASEKEGWQSKKGGDIVYDETFDNFHFKIDWKISEGGNSGIIFYVQEDTAYKYAWQTGMEMQVLDNDGHADGKITKHRAGDLYDLIACSKETVKPVGEWNTAEIISNNGQLDFVLNGEKVVATTLWDSSWNNLIAGSKFKDMPGFGSFKSGKIALQDHGNDVWFKNVMIKKL